MRPAGWAFVRGPLVLGSKNGVDATAIFGFAPGSIFVEVYVVEPSAIYVDPSNSSVTSGIKCEELGRLGLITRLKGSPKLP